MRKKRNNIWEKIMIFFFLLLIIVEICRGSVNMIKINGREYNISKVYSLRDDNTFAPLLRSKDGVKVELDGKVYNLQDENTLVSMLRSKNRVEEIIAVEFLLYNPKNRKLTKKEVINGMIDLYKELPSLTPISIYKYGNNKKEDAVRKMTISLFTMIVTSENPQGEVILEEALKGDDETMRTAALLLKDSLQKLEKEKQRIAEKQKAPIILPPSILDISTDTVENLTTILSITMDNSSYNLKFQTLQQLSRQSNYLKNKEGEGRRLAVINVLKDYYKKEKELAIRSKIIEVLLNIGKKDVRPFLESIIEDEQTPRTLRESVQFAIKVLDLEEKQ